MRSCLFPSALCYLVAKEYISCMAAGAAAWAAARGSWGCLAAELWFPPYILLKRCQVWPWVVLWIVLWVWCLLEPRGSKWAWNILFGDREKFSKQKEKLSPPKVSFISIKYYFLICNYRSHWGLGVEACSYLCTRDDAMAVNKFTSGNNFICSFKTLFINWRCFWCMLYSIYWLQGFEDLPMSSLSLTYFPLRVIITWWPYCLMLMWSLPTGDSTLSFWYD